MKFYLQIALATILLAFVTPVHAGSKPPVAPKTFKPVISEVKKDSVTVKTGTHAGYKVFGVGENGLPKQEQAANVEIYSVNQLTKITLNGKPAKLTDLKAGMEVQVTAGVDRKVAATIAAKAGIAKW